MKNTALLGILAVLVLEAGCMMGPKYKRPAVNVPQQYRTPEPQLATQASSLGNEQWWQLYQDPVLTQLIHTAIAQNYDVRIAAARVLEAQAQVGITRSNQFPSASVGADIYSQQNAKVTKVFPAYYYSQRGRPESIGDLESGLLGKIPPTNRSGSRPVTGYRVGTTSSAFFAGC